MLYDYKCELCGVAEEEARLSDDRDLPSKCPRCGIYRKRQEIYSQGRNFGTFQEGLYHAFGKVFTTPWQLKNEIQRIKGEEGRDIVEVGNARFPDKQKMQWPDKRDMVERVRWGKA